MHICTYLITYINMYTYCVEHIYIYIYIYIYSLYCIYIRTEYTTLAVAFHRYNRKVRHDVMTLQGPFLVHQAETQR